MPANKLARPVQAAWRRCKDRPVPNISLDVGCQLGHGSVSTLPCLFQSLSGDPVKVAIYESAQGGWVGLALRGDVGRRCAHCTQLTRKRRRLFFTNDTQHLGQPFLPQSGWVERNRSDEELVQNHTERIHIR